MGIPTEQGAPPKRGSGQPRSPEQGLPAKDIPRILLRQVPIGIFLVGRENRKLKQQTRNTTPMKNTQPGEQPHTKEGTLAIFAQPRNATR